VTALILVRHGETTTHAENRYTGVTDVGLTPDGERQAELLGRWARSAGLTAIVSSPLSRCVRTARDAAAVTKLQISSDSRLRELDFGSVEGLSAGEIEVRLPGVMEAFRSDPVSHPFPDGEDVRDAANRAVEALVAIAAERADDDRVLVVAHSTLLRLALCRLLGLPLERYRTIFPYLDNCARTELRIRGADVALIGFNLPVSSPDRNINKEAIL